MAISIKNHEDRIIALENRNIGYRLEYGEVQADKGNGRNYSVSFSKPFSSTPTIIMGDGYYYTATSITAVSRPFVISETGFSFRCITSSDHSPKYPWIAIGI